MTRDGYNSLVAELSLVWSDRPRGLLRETIVWVLFGYAALVVALMGCLALLAVGVVLAVFYQGVVGTLAAGAIALAGFLAAVLLVACLWVKFDPPQGIVLDEEDHPELHRVIRETGRQLGHVRFHKVVMDAEMNAAAVQNPRLGIFGWYRSYLVIGLPLMEILTLEEFRAVLAHEFAHVGGPDGRTRAWLHRTRATWEKIAGRLPASPLCPLLAKFVHWFWPRFNSRAFLLSRFNELEADRISADAVSPEVLASGLRRLAIQGQRLDEELWQPLEAAIPGSAPLPDDVMDKLSALVRSEPCAVLREHWASQAMALGTEPGDTHPGLAERLSRLNPPAEGALSCLVPERCAAEELLGGDFIRAAKDRFNREWLSDAIAARAAHRRASEDASDARCVRDAWKRIAALSRLDGLEKVQPEVLALLERRPDHSGALFLRGCHLAHQNDGESAAYLERAASDPIIAQRAFETLAIYHARCGNTAEMDTLRVRAARHERELRSALMERGRVDRKDAFLPHDLSPREMELLRETLAAEPAVRRAWLGSKQVTHFPGWKLLVLVVDARWPAFKPVSERTQCQLLERLTQHWEIDAYVHPVRLDEGTRPVLRAIRRRVADSEVYCRH
jgi:Zn-dependent protease with chaperone function